MQTEGDNHEFTYRTYTGVTCGALPIILGAIMEELEVGVLGFVASCVSALFLVCSVLFLFQFCVHFI